jgi:putative transposase
MYRKVRPLDPTQVYQSDLTDAQWARLVPLLPRQQGSGKAQQIPLRSIVNGCLYLLRTGCQWRMLPREYPKWEIVYYHFTKWHRTHVWQDVLEVLREEDRVAAGREPAPSLVIVDSQSTKTTEMGGEVGYDAGKKTQGAETAYRGRHPRDAGRHPGACGEHLGP